MKILFYLIVLANVVVFLWHSNAEKPYFADDTVELADSKPQQIWLLSEVEKKPPVTVATRHKPPVSLILTAPATVITRATKNNPQHLVTSTIRNTPQINATATMPVAVVKPLYCYRITGFSDKTAMSKWAQQQNFDKTTLKIHGNSPVIADYLVHYPAATIAESRKNVAFLKKMGITEFFMIKSGEKKGAISLGVFKNETRAFKAQQVLRNKGIRAEVGKRYKTASTVSAYLKSEKTKPQFVATLSKYTPTPSVTLVPHCE